MREFNCAGKSTQQVINELSKLPQNETIKLTVWNSNTREALVSKHVQDMKYLKQEEDLMNRGNIMM